MGVITHAIGNALNPEAGNAQRATDASNQAYSHDKQAQAQALKTLQGFLTSNPNPAQGFGGIQGPDLAGRPTSVGGPGGPQMPNPASPGLPGGPQGQTPGIAGQGALPMRPPQAGQAPPELIQLLSKMAQQQGGGGGQPQTGAGPTRPLPNIQLPHPGPIIRMGPQQ